ncbi:hypothetical protein C8D88_101477 [Lentzea atacamensis]|uniref:Uncharacterized protein n=1 Tax=Lentzea atacamensis TaxID=531938 RepID=A0A316IB73_9PSEU|nr:hypothetical protein [Lentzea atacamensis]PWK90461.1 hypothetical protein C8D88_101477 [Lentzea atacamensis]RAS68316.1 hypothetical protein C8D87_102381 [Lentzea atacamensis]
MPGFYTDPQGRVRPIRGKGTSYVVAGALALGVVGSSGGVASIGGGAGGAAPAGGGTSSTQLRARKSDGQKAARKGDANAAWQRMGLRQLRRTARQQAECLAVSFGEVREFFTRTRCTSLERVLFAVTDGAGNVAAVSVVWVGLPSDGDARKFRTLMDRHGSGDIRPLGSAVLGLADIQFTGLRYGSDRDGKRVTAAEAENATGNGFDHETLDAIAEVAAYLPPV